MPLTSAPAVTIGNLIGGYNANLNYTNMQDNMTNDARNVYITVYGSIKERPGYIRRLNTRLRNASSADVFANGTPITGHFQLVKLGNSSTTVKAEVVASGESLYKYTATSASKILSITDQSETFWQFAQIQDPRSASNDVVVMANGLDKIHIWDGTEISAVLLSAVTSATQVPTAKFITSLQNRLYALNIVDTADVDSKVKVAVTEFSKETGAPRPQRFTNSFYVGGSDKFGEITGHAIINDQLVIFKRNATYKFIPGSGRLIDTAGLVQMDEAVGCIAPESVATVGNIVVFLSEIGIYAFDGGNFVKISHQLDKDFINLDRSLLKYAKGYYHKEANQYWISMQDQDNEYITFVYDLDKKIWFPPYEGFKPYYMSSYRDDTDTSKLLFGDPNGYLYTADVGTADGRALGYTGVFDGVAGAIYTDSSATFDTSADGLAGLTVRFITGDPKNDKWRTIIANDATSITTDTAFDFTPGTANTYVIAGINSYYRTKDYAFGSPDIDKLFRRVTIRGGQLGNVETKMNYIVDFKSFNRAGTATFNLIGDGMTYDYSNWDAAYWDGTDQVIKRVNLRPLNTQALTGKFLALRFLNQQFNQPWEIFGFDIQMKHAGRRNR